MPVEAYFSTKGSPGDTGEITSRAASYPPDPFSTLTPNKQERLRLRSSHNRSLC